MISRALNELRKCPVKNQTAVIDQVIFKEEVTDEKNDLFYLEFSSGGVNGLHLIRFVF